MERVKSSKKNILIVDDDVSFAQLLEIVLKDEDYNILVSNNGEKALQLIRGNIFDLILLDIEIPKISGLMVLKYVKEHNPDTKVIILTGHSGIKNAIEALKYGANEFMSKPPSMEDLLMVVKRNLQ
jgi:DNA-binding NtrC family response regulator